MQLVPVPQPRSSAFPAGRRCSPSTAATSSGAGTREANRSSGPAVSVLSRLVSGVRRPRQPILGSEFAGVVEEVGATAGEFTVGDHVFGTSGLRFGAYAEYMCMRAGGRIAAMP